MKIKFKKLKINHKYYDKFQSEELYFIVREDRMSYYVVDSLCLEPEILEEGIFSPSYEIEKIYDELYIEKKIVAWLEERGAII